MIHIIFRIFYKKQAISQRHEEETHQTGKRGLHHLLTEEMGEAIRTRPVRAKLTSSSKEQH